MIFSITNSNGCWESFPLYWKLFPHPKHKAIRLSQRDSNVTTKLLYISFNGWLNTIKWRFTELELGKPGGVLFKSSWRNDDGNDVIILKLLLLGRSYAAVVLLMSLYVVLPMLCYCIPDCWSSKFFRTSNFLIRTGALRPTTLLLIICDATLAVAFSLHLLNVVAKFLMFLFFEPTTIVCPQNPSELYLGQFESHLIESFLPHKTIW